MAEVDTDKSAGGQSSTRSGAGKGKKRSRAAAAGGSGGGGGGEGSNVAADLEVGDDVKFMHGSECRMVFVTIMEIDGDTDLPNYRRLRFTPSTANGHYGCTRTTGKSGRWWKEVSGRSTGSATAP